MHGVFFAQCFQLEICGMFRGWGRTTKEHQVTPAFDVVNKDAGTTGESLTNTIGPKHPIVFGNDNVYASRKFPSSEYNLHI